METNGVHQYHAAPRPRLLPGGTRHSPILGRDVPEGSGLLTKAEKERIPLSERFRLINYVGMTITVLNRGALRFPRNMCNGSCKLYSS